MNGMPQMRITDLLANTPTDPEAHLDAGQVERYAQMLLDALPPVVVFDTGEELLLADGYHRVAAARRRGLETIEAEVRLGSRHDALRYAATVGAAQRGISPDAAASYIRRRSQSHQGEGEHTLESRTESQGEGDAARPDQPERRPEEEQRGRDETGSESFIDKAKRNLGG